ncbi:diphosphomevalonate decarboxylase [Candidatus Roizmanbacteria bacterium CG22_combo_CG10-13_8_21_14_all_33_16]|uniref:diphosphomevalonate decarboxylase n=3 Tax=Candidatus Roizmaniibacteriota TaxID=1752723 RepID=A0A2H0C438_9BACT|nr:MAG: diphosphomevalonate decarboxylase [Candidatus Roizmanbacteria bacterium CG22_combo_CG10-13_8_21_14_all_33_16]
MKATAIAPANIAFIKYWGKKDEELRLPTNGSISMNLSNLLTTTTVEFSSRYKKDEILINNKIDEKENKRVENFLDKVRQMAKSNLRAKVVSENNFPKSGGLASSASGFAALTVAATASIGLNLSKEELSILARIGSGSACRSIPHGFVEWFEGNDSQSSFAQSIHPADYWNILDIIVIFQKGDKKITSTDGQKLVKTSLFFKERLNNIKNKIENIKELIKQKDFINFGELVEKEALELHAIMLTSDPPILYLQPKSIEIIQAVWQWRSEGLSVYFTIDAGPNIHLICQEKDQKQLVDKLQKIKGIKYIVNSPTVGTRLTKKYLF